MEINNQEQSHTATQTQDKTNNKLMGILAYLGVLIIIPALISRDNTFVKFHIKQGLVLIVLELITSIITRFPLGGLVSPILGIATLVLIIIGILNVLHNKTQELPLIGQYAKNFNF